MMRAGRARRDSSSPLHERLGEMLLEAGTTAEALKQLFQICEKGDKGARPELEAARKAATD